MFNSSAYVSAKTSFKVIFLPFFVIFTISNVSLIFFIVAGFKVVSNVADKYYAGYDTYSFPGNALGFAYPTLSLGYDNSTVFATWSQPSVTGGKVDTAAGGIAKMDLWWNVSLDGGTTWKTAAKLAGTSG